MHIDPQSRDCAAGAGLTEITTIVAASGDYSNVESAEAKAKSG